MEQPTRAAVYLIIRNRLREDRKTSGKIKCNPPNRQCGDRCIPPNWKCRVKGEGTDSHSRVVAGDPLAGAASIARGQARLRKGLKTGNVVEIQAGRAAIARGLVKAVPGQNLKQKQELRARVERVIIPVAGTLFAAWVINRGHEAAKLIVPGYKQGIGKAIEESAATGIGFVFDRIPFYGAAREASRRQANVAGQKLARAVLRNQLQGPDISPRSSANTYATIASQSDRKISGLRSAIESIAPSSQDEGYETYRSRFLSEVMGKKDLATNKSIFANAAAVEHLSKQFGLDSSKFKGADDNVKKTYLNRAIENKLTETQTAMRQDMSVRGLSYTKQDDVEKYLEVASGYAIARFSGLGKDETKSVLNSYKGFVRDLVSPISKENSVKTLTSKMYNETVDSFDKFFQQASTRVAQATSPTARVLIPEGDSPLRASLLGAARFVGPRVGVKIPINSANVAELVLRKTYHELGQQSTGFKSNRKTAWNAPDSDVKAAARDLGWDGNGGIVAAHKIIRATGAFNNLQQLPVVDKPTRTFAPAANGRTKPKTTRKPTPRSRSQIISMLIKGDPTMSPEAAANEADRIIARRKDEDDIPISVQLYMLTKARLHGPR